MNFYTAYGVQIASELPLPELSPSPEINSVVQIRFGQVAPMPIQPTAIDACFHVLSPTRVYFCWDSVGRFLVENGTHITIDPNPGVEERLIRLPLLGIVIATLLYQRGILVLHSSAVAINGGAIAFVGDKGQGKSTMAATLYGLGHALFSDDVVAIHLNENESATVLPGAAMMKLYPEAIVASLGEDPASLIPMHPQVNKGIRLAFDQFSTNALPLTQLYVLADGATVDIRKLSAQEAFQQMMAHAYIGRLGQYLLTGQTAVQHFRQCTQLIQHVPVYALERPRSLELLPEIARRVMENAEPSQTVVSMPTTLAEIPA